MSHDCDIQDSFSYQWSLPSCHTWGKTHVLTVGGQNVSFGSCSLFFFSFFTQKDLWKVSINCRNCWFAAAWLNKSTFYYQKQILCLCWRSFCRFWDTIESNNFISHGESSSYPYIVICGYIMAETAWFSLFISLFHTVVWRFFFPVSSELFLESSSKAPVCWQIALPISKGF